jgi:hypothetical protein
MTTSELDRVEANARAQLADNPEPADCERLEKRLAAIADERESRVRLAAGMAAGSPWHRPR